MLARIRWGAVLMGAVSGLFVMVVASVVLFVVVQFLGLDISDLRQILVLGFAFFLGQLCSGYVGGRLTSADQPGFHGSISGMALYAILSTLSIARGSPIDNVSLLLLGLVAAVIGYAGGVLGGRPRDEGD